MKILKSIKNTITIVALVLVIGGAFTIINFGFPNLIGTRITRSASAVAMVQDVSQFVSLQVNYRDIITSEEASTFFNTNVNIPFTQSGHTIKYEGTIHLGINTEDIIIEENGNQISVTLPPVEVIAHELHRDTVDVLNERNQVFSSFSIQDVFDHLVERKPDMVQWATDTGAFERAMENAVEHFNRVLSIGLGEDYDIIINTL